MKLRLLLSMVLLGGLAVSAEGKPNILLICIDDLRPELGCYGSDYIRSPNIDRLAERSLLFSQHYVQAPTCGASRYALLTGTYDRQRRGNEALFSRASTLGDPPEQRSLPRYFRDHGYTTVSVGKVSHHPGGRGGDNWDDPSKPEMPGAWNRHLQPTGAWKHPRGVMHGLARGEIRGRADKMAVYQSEPGPDDIYPDGLTTRAALEELEALKNDGKPFLLAVGLIRPHLPFGAPKGYFDPYRGTKLPPILHPEKPTGKTTWHGSCEFMKYLRWGHDPRKEPEFAEEIRRHYAACVSYADAQVGKLLDRLGSLGLADDTLVVLWGDHGWHLGEHAVWGKHTLFEESLRAPLIIHQPGMRQTDRRTSYIAETVDLYPTLCELAGLPAPSFLDGQSLLPVMVDPQRNGGSAISYNEEATTLRTPDYRLTVHDDGVPELYDHRTPEGETRNLADEQAAQVEKLRQQLAERMKP